MRVIERITEFHDWPISRKVVQSVGLSTFSLCVGWLTAHYLGVESIVALALLKHFLAIWIGAGILVIVVSLPAALAGRDARWTAYVDVLTFSVFGTTLIYLFGTMSTPLAAIYPCFVVLWVLNYSNRIGVFGFIFFSLLLISVGFLERAGTLPYAPLLLERSVDSQKNVHWFFAMLLTISQVFSAGLMQMISNVWASKQQSIKLHTAHQQLARSSQLISRYVPSQLAEKIIKGEHPENSRPERLKLTVFFSDLEGFTDASDRMDPEDLASVLNEYLSEMMTIAEYFGATINQIVGDGIMIFIGAPQSTSDEDHALRAVRMALEMQRRMRELQVSWVKRGIEKPFQARIGINTGYASLGDYGSPGRKLYSAIGVQTNLAARIQSHCTPGNVLISHSTWALVKDEIAYIDKGEFQFKGLHHPVRIYEVTQKAPA